jgi:tRNA (cmo5U34)-methyltransferase
MAIHHLEHFQKYELYSRIYTALKYKGIFVNIDIVKPINASVEALQFNMWKNCIFDELSAQNNVDEFKKHENITDVYKNNHENKPSTLNSQIAMLENIGFVDVDCHYKNGAFAMFSGQKC